MNTEILAGSNLNNPNLTVILFAIMVKRLGGEVTIDQAAIDDIAFSRLEEKGRVDGSITFRVVAKPLVS